MKALRTGSVEKEALSVETDSSSQPSAISELDPEVVPVGGAPQGVFLAGPESRATAGAWLQSSGWGRIA